MAHVMAICAGDASIASGANIILIAGGGKSHLVSAIDLAPVENGWRVDIICPTRKRDSWQEGCNVLARLKRFFSPKYYYVIYPEGFTAAMSKERARGLAALHGGIVTRGKPDALTTRAHAELVECVKAK